MTQDEILVENGTRRALERIEPKVRDWIGHQVAALRAHGWTGPFRVKVLVDVKPDSDCIIEFVVEEIEEG